MNGQISIEEYFSRTDAPSSTGLDCLCKRCLYWWSGRCPNGGCFDYQRADSENRCKGGTLYITRNCQHFAKYQREKTQIKECFEAVTVVYQDGYMKCSLADTAGCWECYDRFLKEDQ